ncbi:4F2 cell-surface antigen heavy chain [Plectropomus leopardus]|uniref:4F2 cell-surface antigen heavy chain n=1 Tax=Plectropomus leopardus TaxID=160734 RepID=UPI001C4D6C36|nr:4F2 cell-surface antigen heavy chain [Plectropomus leopardus]
MLCVFALKSRNVESCCTCSPPVVHMEPSDKEPADEPDRMPLNAGGDTGYGSVAGSGLSGSVGASESAPLLIPEPEPELFQRWQPLSKEELEVAAGGPGWRKVRCYLVLVFWLAWLAMLAISIAIIAVSPRPVETPLKWWQKTLFYQLEPELLPERQAEGSEGLKALCEELPYLRSLGIGALILEGLFDKKASPLKLNATGERFGTLPQIQHLLAESTKAGLKVVLDVCELDLLGPEEVAGSADVTPNLSATEHYALRFWLEQGAAGFVICDTDAAYSEKTLLEWKGVFKDFSSEEEERIVVVKQTRDILPPLENSSQRNSTLVDVVMRSILPPSQYPLSAKEVADAIETHLQREDEDIWPGWTVGGKASPDLKNLLLVLTMTLPGSPAVQYDEDIDQIVSVKDSSSHEDTDETSDTQADKEKRRRSAVALFTSLSHSRAREEALLFGSFTFLPFNSSTNSSSSSNSTLPSHSSPPILAFLRSWGCVHFLILLNVGPEPHALDPAWAPSLPKAGVFVTNTGMDRLGSTTLDALVLRPQEAIVIKLFEAGSYS